MATQDPSELFDLLEQLGEGSYGSVYKGIHRESGRNVAVKIIPVENETDEVIREIEILKKCKSEYVVHYFGSYFKDGDLWIVLEYCGAGSACDVLHICQKTFTERQIASTMAAVLKGLEYLHKNHNIHRDVKAGNVLLTIEGRAKLADFGVSAQLSNTLSKRKTVIGTPFWMAPEVIQEADYDGRADIWSLGITAIELAEGKPPLATIHPMRAIFLIPSRPPPTLSDPSKFSPELSDFIAACLKKDPRERPSATELLSHPFVRDAVAEIERNEGASPVLEELVRTSMDRINAYREEALRAEGGTMRTATETMVRMARDSESDEDDDDDDDDDDEGMNTMVYKTARGTLSQALAETGGPRYETMVSADASAAAEAEQPSFMDYFQTAKSTTSHGGEGKDGGADAVAAVAASIPAWAMGTIKTTTQPLGSTRDELESQLSQLEADFERDLAALKQQYAQRRARIERKLKEVDGGTVMV